MKSLLFSAVLLLSSLPAFACENPEAQFIGTVKEHAQTDKTCAYKIQFRFFNASQLCPLDDMQASYTWFQDANCSLQDGAEVSGILIVDDQGRIVIE